jgi:type I restriction-modification system DNA methylase subunit
LAEYIAKELSKADGPRERFFTLKKLADKTVRQLVDYCREAGGEAPTICGKKVKEALSFRNLSRMMTYVLATKILAYKVLELHYNIQPLLPLSDAITVGGERVEVSGPNDIVKALDKIFATASRRLEELIQVRDFKPIFETGLYDKIMLEGYTSINKVNELIGVAETIKESLTHLPGIMGYVYEGFIPPAERHQLGQFYTPPAVARLITNWSIRSGDDRVLDGGCGSGTFLIEAYKRLLFLKYNKVYGESYPSCSEDVNEHQEVLNRLHGVDVNAFATQMTALHLMLMEPRCPFTRLNLECRDFFSLTANDLEETGLFDAVIGNPPYTRWVEIPDGTRRLIEDRTQDLIQSYNLVADLGMGREPGIYTYWILHAAKNLLKDGGRLGMIISNMWLQTDYGVGFGKFLLDNFKIKALIDISYRLFDAIISTVIVLAEKEQNNVLRDSNEALLVRIPPIDSNLSDKEVEKKVDDILKDIENTISFKNNLEYEFDKSALEKISKQHGIWYGFVKQSQIPRDKKWISLFFQAVEYIVDSLERHPLMIKIGEWFKPARGNSVWSIWALEYRKRPDLGAKGFFYFNKDKVREWERKVEKFATVVKPYLMPGITASRYVKTFTFKMSDWEQLKNEGRNAYILVLHKEKDKLSQQLKTYVRWGETECKTKIRGTRGGGVVCSEAEACRAREEARRKAIKEGRKPLFYGWYDLGGYIPTPIMAIRQARYHPQFFLVTENVVTYDAIITFIPRVRIKIEDHTYDPISYNTTYDNPIDEVKADVELDEAEVKAILAYLNSTFNWIWLEQNARYIAKGPLGLEVSTVERMPCLDAKRIDRSHVKKLAELFDKLESEARQLISRNNSSLKDQEAEEEEGGKKFEMFKKLESVFKEIDAKVAEILGITTNQDMLWSYAWEMMERRIKGAGRRVKPGAEIEIGVRIESTKRKKKRAPSRDTTVPLTKWIEGYGDEEDKLRSNSIS